MSAISSLLNIAAFRSLTVGLVACQLGSVVGSSFSWLVPMLLIDSAVGDCKQNVLELCAPGDASGELGMLEGWVMSRLSRWLSNALLCGGDISTSLLTASREKLNYAKLFTLAETDVRLTFLTVDPVRLRIGHVGRFRVSFHLRNLRVQIRHGHYLMKNLKLSMFCTILMKNQ